MKKLQIIKFGAVAFIGFIFYTSFGFPLHFFNHFFPAVTVGLIVLIILSRVGVITEKYEFIIPLLFWLYALIPEFIFIITKQQHPQWTNIFLFHEWLDKLLEISTITIIASGLLATISLVLYLRLRKSLA